MRSASLPCCWRGTKNKKFLERDQAQQAEYTHAQGSFYFSFVMFNNTTALLTLESEECTTYEGKQYRLCTQESSTLLARGEEEVTYISAGTVRPLSRPIPPPQREKELGDAPSPSRPIRPTKS